MKIRKEIPNIIYYLKEKDLMTNSIMEGRNLLNEYRDALSDVLSNPSSDKFANIKMHIILIA